MIERNALAQAKLIDDILDVSRVVAGKVSLQRSPMDLRTAVQAALDTVQPSADAKGIAIGATFAPGLGCVLGDPGRLEQVFWNLLGNAVKFTPVGGRVTVEVAHATGNAGAEALEVRVSDDGEGIDAAFLPHVFDRFRQAESHTARTQRGLGLGLAIVRHLVELHGGRVSAEPGTRPWSDVPREAPGRRASAASPTSRTVAPMRAERGSRGCASWWSTTTTTRARSSSVFSVHGAEVRGAASVDEAIHAIEALRPDVVVADIEMPTEDGFALIRRLRALEAERARHLAPRWRSRGTREAKTDSALDLGPSPRGQAGRARRARGGDRAHRARRRATRHVARGLDARRSDARSPWPHALRRASRCGAGARRWRR